MNNFLQSICPVVTEDMNIRLTLLVTEDKIRNSLFSIGPSRAPGPDGFTAKFYQEYWEFVGPSIITVVQNLFDTGILPDGFNHTNLFLIPKVRTPESIKEIRPISLYNVIYKIISKILVWRLKEILSDIVTENQAAFVPGRHISDNTILAHEAFHSQKVRERVSQNYMAVKTDISKAYDRIEWDFLEAVLCKKRFCEVWITWIRECVTYVTFSVLLNGSSH